MSAIDSGESELSQAIRDLLLQWASSAEGWRDHSRSRFGAVYIDDLTALGDRAIAAIDGVSEMLRRMHRDCQMPEGQ